MNKKVLLIVVLAILTSGLSAQSLGVKLGYSFSKSFSDDPVYDTGLRKDLFYGGFVTFRLSEKSRLQGEFLVYKKGGEISATDKKIDFSLKYYKIPLLLKYDILAQVSFKAGVMVGPYLGLLRSAKLKEKYDLRSIETNVKSNMKNTDFGIIVGGYIEFMSFVVEARISYGITNIHKTGDSIRNKSMSISIGKTF